MDPDVGRLAQILTVVAAFGGFVTVMWLVARAVTSRIGRGAPRSQSFPPVDDARFTRLEQSLESIAIEVERIAEAQRFQAKLMAERAGEGAAVPLPRQSRAD